ncbi:PAP2 superfamily-domain-containing protein [Halenospora varia]|nr:PAP2 superfamily-domain-containing protein [Halenospora varia]
MRLNYKSRANPGRISVALVLSYAFDWLILLAAVAVGSIFAIQTPNKRPFSLTNPEISFPFVNKEKVPLWILGVCTLIVPMIVIAAVALILVPGPTVSKATPKSLIWRRKLWEWHTGWLGLGLSLASAYVITNGMKNLFGKPRPDLLARCKPDYANVEKYVYAGFNGTVNLVSAAICTSTDKSTLDDGFRSYPSGHASWSAAGLIYLSLFLASKLAITIPFLPPQSYSKEYESSFGAFPSRAERKAAEKHHQSGETLAAPAGTDDVIVGSRNQAAAPPIYLLVIAVIPWLSSVYISSTRYSDFRHHGFDILFGYFIGTVCAIFAFRYYHLPLTRGAGWSWGPRSRERSFWAGVGVGNYAGSKPRIVNIEQHEMDIESSPIEGRPTNDVGEAESSSIAVKGS